MKRLHVVVLFMALVACGARTGLAIGTSSDASLGDDASSSDASLGDGDAAASDGQPFKACPADHVTVLVADAGFGFGALTIDEGSIYWVSWSPIGVESAPKTGGAPTALVVGLSGPTGLAVSSGYVFWTDFNTNEVGRVSTDGGAPTVLATGQANAVSVAVSDDVYWTTWKTGTMDRVPLDGGAVESLSTANANYAEITTDGQHVFWAVNEGSIMAYSFATKTVSVLATAAKGRPYAIATDGTNVYWRETDDATGTLYIVRASVQGGPSTVLASVSPDDAGLCYANKNCQGEIATDGQHVYFTVDGDAGAVMKLPVNGGAPTVIAEHQNLAWGIAVDEACVYWHTWDAVIVSPK